MPETRHLVINTGPVIALVAAMGKLDLLRDLYERVVVPHEVAQEIECGGQARFAVSEFAAATWLERRSAVIAIPPALSSALDLGEASVIHTASMEDIRTVCIDEAAGRRLARLNGLSVTGSPGILVRAKREGYPVVLRDSIASMRERGIWLSRNVELAVLREAGE